MRTKIVFHVDAGRFESDDEKNYKYCDQAETLVGAIEMYEKSLGYEFVDFYLVITFPNGAKRTVYLDGGDCAEERMRMSIANLWMQVTGNDFFSLTEGPTLEQQIEAIEGVLEARAHLEQSVVRQLNTIRTLEVGLAARDARISALKFELDMGLAQKLVWQDIHARFKDNQLTWTEAFDALMSQCGMPMEDALRRLAENFDRRPAVNVKEV